MNIHSTKNIARHIAWLVGLVLLSGSSNAAYGQSDTRIKPEPLKQNVTPPVQDPLPTQPPVDATTQQPPINNQDPSTGGDTQPFETGRIRSIHERISLLKKLMAEDKKRLESQEQDNNSAPKFPTQPDNGSMTETSQGDESTSPPDGFTPTLPVDPNAVNQGSGTPITTEPVNSFELGNSLFMTGNYSASLKSYQAMLNEKPDLEDELWIRCMMGCCYRLSGDYTNAEAMFREVSNKGQPDEYAVDYARWSLNYIEKRRISRGEFQLITSELEAAISELNNAPQSK